jgi:hypothetical protein
MPSSSLQGNLALGAEAPCFPGPGRHTLGSIQDGNLKISLKEVTSLQQARAGQIYCSNYLLINSNQLMFFTNLCEQ